MGQISVGLIAGSFIAFALATVAVAIDVQDTIRARLGQLANTSILSVPQGWLMIVAWGLFDAVLYLVIVAHPEWARNTFLFDVDQNKVMAGVAVGISAVFVIRSKLAKVGNVELGGEFAYLWSRAYVLDAVTRAKVQKRIANEKRYGLFAENIAKYPSLFTDLSNWLIARADGKPDEVKSRIGVQVGEIRKNAKPVPENADQDPNARKYLFGVAMDFFTPAEIDALVASLMGN